MNRIGCIVPSINVTVEDDFRLLCPGNVGLHFTRADVDQSLELVGQFAQMAEAAPDLAAQLAKAGVGTVAFACTSASFFRGVMAEKALRDAMTAAACVPCTTTAAAVLDAIRALDASRIGLATPYVQWVYESEKAYFEEHGVEVVAAAGLDRRGGCDISGISPSEIRGVVASVDDGTADALFVSCTDLPVLNLIDELERHHAKPVITSNQATYWQCARRLGLGPQSGFGRLLEQA